MMLMLSVNIGQQFSKITKGLDGNRLSVNKTARTFFAINQPSQRTFVSISREFHFTQPITSLRQALDIKICLNFRVI